MSQRTGGGVPEEAGKYAVAFDQEKAVKDDAISMRLRIWNT
jgi:hypothetical protein